MPAHLLGGSLRSHTENPKTDSHHHKVTNAKCSAISTEYTGKSSEGKLHVLLCPSSAATIAQLNDILSTCDPLQGEEKGAVQIRTIRAPRLPPISEEQATKWSERYWPTVYRASNPFGAHPSIVSRAQSQLLHNAGAWMAIAQEAAKQARLQGDGEAIGAVIVDKSGSDVAQTSLVVVAGDGRWYQGCQETDYRKDKVGPGNVAAHAVMRAIGMVARKRREQSAGLPSEVNSLLGERRDCIFLDRAMTIFEKEAYANSVLDPKGYLCVGLNIYVSHEPCVMCSMALLHSRFDRVVFGQRMVVTGGLSAQVSDEAEGGHHQSGAKGLGYGLFWRPELNWKFLAFQWEDKDLEGVCRVEPTVHA